MPHVAPEEGRFYAMFRPTMASACPPRATRATPPEDNSSRPVDILTEPRGSEGPVRAWSAGSQVRAAKVPWRGVGGTVSPRRRYCPGVNTWFA